MIESSHKIEFITASGTFVLLDIGQLVGSPIPWPAEQGSENYNPLGSVWGTGQGMGGAQRMLEFMARKEHASRAALNEFCIIHPATLMAFRTGTVQVTISGGSVWQFPGARLMSATPVPALDSLFGTDTVYRLQVGAGVPVSGLAHYAGIPTSWIAETHTSISRTHAAS